MDTREQNTAALRKVFKQMNKFMLLMWRLGFGPFINNPQVGYIMVLTTTGHKSGLRRRAPVNFDRDGDNVYCIAAYGEKTHWYRNLVADPNCEVWLPGEWWAGVAEEVTGIDERLPILRRVLIRSGFAARAFEGIEPKYMSEDQLREQDAHYKVMRIRLIARRTGPDGPGDLAWIWPAVLGMLLMWLAWRSSRAA
jgi:deazaflavin-dependent oxidoreductase (nitroreductase family)